MHDREVAQLRQPRHRAVFVHDLADYAGGIHAGDARDVHGRFKLTKDPPPLGNYVRFSSIRGFKGLCEGKYDHLPEAAFYMVGTIEQAVEKGKRLAAEAA